MSDGQGKTVVDKKMIVFVFVVAIVTIAFWASSGSSMLVPSEKVVACPEVHYANVYIQCKTCNGEGDMNDGWLFDTKCAECDGQKVVICPRCEGSLTIKEPATK